LLKIKAAKEDEVTEKDVSGYRCKRGLVYAVNECTNPVRTLTTTIKAGEGRRQLVPVKSSKPIPKNKLFECVAVINSSYAQVPVKVGDIIIRNILDTGADIVSTTTRTC